jgi:Flp pilus assembly protein TadG
MKVIKKIRCFIINEKGQAVVETALIVPILLLFLCMIVDTGRIVYAESKLNLICQESVRVAGLGGGDTQVHDYAFSKLDADTASTLQVTVSPVDTLRKSGDFVTVTLNVTIKYITPLANVILPSPFKAIAESTIRVE